MKPPLQKQKSNIMYDFLNNNNNKSDLSLE